MPPLRPSLLPQSTADKRRNHQLAADGFIADSSLAVARACLEEVWLNSWSTEYCVRNSHLGYWAGCGCIL